MKTFVQGHIDNISKSAQVLEKQGVSTGEIMKEVRRMNRELIDPPVNVMDIVKSVFADDWITEIDGVVHVKPPSIYRGVM